MPLFGRLRLQQGRHAAAADLIGRALEVDPEIPGGCTAMGIALSNLDRLDEAVASFMRAVAQRGDDLQTQCRTHIGSGTQRRTQRGPAGRAE